MSIPKTQSGVYLGLPEGLYLPLACESPERFSKDNFSPNMARPDRLVDYAIFATALKVLNPGDNVSYMPKQDDFAALSNAGYGVSLNTIDRRMGGVSALQERLGFYTKGSSIDTTKLERRLRWLLTEVVPIVPELAQQEKVKLGEVVAWGAARNLCPGMSRIRGLYGDTHDLRKRLDILHLNQKIGIKNDLLLAGRIAIERFDGPVSSAVMGELLPKSCTGSFAYHAAREFGSVQAFWEKFGLYFGNKGGLETKIVDAAVRLVHQEGSISVIKSGHLTQFAAAKLLPYEETIVEKFGGIRQFRQMVIAEVEKLDSVRSSAVEDGITMEVLDEIMRSFVDVESFGKLVADTTNLLRAVSDRTPHAVFTRKLFLNGFDIEQKDIFEYQLLDAVKIIKRHLGNSIPAILRGLALIPYQDPAETYQRYVALVTKNS